MEQSKVQHTPEKSEWTIERSGSGCWIEDECGKFVCGAMANDDMRTKWIVAAPDLLAALLAAKAQILRMSGPDAYTTLTDIEAAIAKATGKAGT